MLRIVVIFLKCLILVYVPIKIWKCTVHNKLFTSDFVTVFTLPWQNGFIGRSAMMLHIHYYVQEAEHK